MLVLLIYEGYYDFRRRKINTLPFLVMDVALLLYYLTVNPLLSIFLIPVISEFLLKNRSVFIYPLIVLPPLLDPTFITISIAYSVLFIKTAGIVVRNFGTGDVKALQTISTSVPTYPNLPVQFALFPPVMGIMLVASSAGLISSIIINYKKEDNSIRKFTYEALEDKVDKVKFWINGSKVVYKIPFVTYISVAFTAFFILSLLRLV